VHLGMGSLLAQVLGENVGTQGEADGDHLRGPRVSLVDSGEHLPRVGCEARVEGLGHLRSVRSDDEWSLAFYKRGRRARTRRGDLPQPR